MEHTFAHETVLLQEAVAALNIKSDGFYIDGTYGRGGHSAQILQSLGDNGRLLVIDKDPDAISDAKKKYAEDKRVMVWQGSFSDFDRALQDFGVSERVHGMLMDLGVSSPQLDDAQRGFSFLKDGSLDMRMNPMEGESAQQWLTTATEKDIADVLWRYGEERFSRQIARKIVATRSTSTLDSTVQLATLIASAVPRREPGKNPATRSFQAIRIKVNGELDSVEHCLDKTVQHLAPEGRLVVISFHSLEDRIVKHFMRDHSKAAPIPKGLPIRDDEWQQKASLKLIGKAIRAGAEEVQCNARSRSAIMRIAERVH